MVSSSSLPKSLLLQFRQTLKISPKFPIPITLSSLAKMSPWTCTTCTFINPSAQKSRCEVCLSAPPHPLALSSPPPPPNTLWPCGACTYLNPYSSAMCEICGTRASATRLSAIEIDDYDYDDSDDKDMSIGGAFMPLKACSNAEKENPGVSGGLSGSASPLARGGSGNFGIGESKCVDNGGSKVLGDGGERGFSAGLRPCSNKRKDREDDNGGDGSSSSAFRGVDRSNEAVRASPLAGETDSCSESKTWKLLTYNVWFREDLEMHLRMRAIGYLIELHSPDVICFQEVTPNFYEIFRRSNWWKKYRCSIPNDKSFPGGYFCMQLSKLPVKSFTSSPFHNSIMGRELCVAEVELFPGTTMAVATSHLESPSPAPPTWNQMYRKERVYQANEAVRLLEKNENVIFCGDMNWDDKSDGPFPLPEGWVDAWTELRPGEEGWTYDTKSNKMLSGNRSLQKRLDRFICKLKGMKISSIEMIGRDEIPGASYIKEKRVKGQVKELSLPVLPSDHYGLLLTICRA